MMVDVITGLPDPPAVGDDARRTFGTAEEQAAFTQIDIAHKKGVYVLSCRCQGKKMPKKTLAAEESAWIDHGVVTAAQLAARLYLHSDGVQASFTGTLF